MFSLDLTGKRAWVTGGNRGIGRAIALALANAGCDVGISFHTAEQQAQQVVAELKALGRKAACAGGDLADPVVCARVHAALSAELGPIDILVNNAGAIRDNLFLMLEPADWQAVIGSNLLSCVNAIRAAAPSMWARKAGRVINLSSVAATKGGAGQANYVATKGAIEAMTRSLAVEFAPRKITVNCVAPGVVETDMSSALIGSAKDEVLARQLVKRFGKPEEIAGWVVMLASQYGDFVTGEIVHVDGGMKMA